MAYFGNRQGWSKIGRIMAIGDLILSMQYVDVNDEISFYNSLFQQSNLLQQQLHIHKLV